MSDQNEVLRAITRLEVKMDTVGERMNDHGQRLRFLEGLAKTATGALAIVGVVVGWMKISVRVQ